MGRMTYVKALMCLLFPSAALVARAQHPVAGDLKCKLTGRTGHRTKRIKRYIE